MNSPRFCKPPPPAIETFPPIVQAALRSPDPAAAAQEYAGLGFSVLPLRGKRPALRCWRDYQHTPAAPETFSAWARAGLFDNVGIVCGAVSGGLVVLDLDGKIAYLTFAARFPHLAETFTVTTGSGVGHHVYLFVEDIPPPIRILHTPLGNVELRSTGQQVVAPPSRHPATGRPYTVMRLLEIQSIKHTKDVAGWIRMLRRNTRPGISNHEDRCRPIAHRAGKAARTRALINPALIDAIAAAFRGKGYRTNKDWLNGPCIYPEHHAHHDDKPSFGYHVKTGYGYCFAACGSILTKDIAARLNIRPADYGGLTSTRRRAR